VEELSKNYNPSDAEDKWYAIWESNGHFKPEANAENHNGETFSVVIPPPNVTGNLHIGHALNHTLQDVLIRYKRKKGFKTLWLPGMDHAGIATQNVVERQLAGEGTSRFDLGREEFVKRVWEWKEQYGGKIRNQQRRLGESVDWSRERFTLDEGLSDAVKEVFVSLYKKGMIYRGPRIINWSPKGLTALSDIEVIFKEKQGKLYHIRYPLTDGSGYITIATTRPETMLGDMAVAANPDDERYTHLKGKTITLPLVDREIPIIFDDYVDPEFGSGLVKITPAHDFNDFEIGNRHMLEPMLIMDEHAVINENGGRFKGLDRYAARKAVLEALEEDGLLAEVKDYTHQVGHCYRTDCEVEPILSTQWFVKVKEMAEHAIAAVEDGRTRFVPKQWEKTYFEWMHNIKDWCVSRQLWWGHRIPAWYCQSCGELQVSAEEPDHCKECDHKEFRQEEDVLDTWFSSGLWPFSTLGWPEETDDLAAFYPTSVLVTGFDIIFFWVARMMMMGLEFRREVPFKDIFIHGLVRDEHGNKFSKSKGNTVDPLEMMEKYGTDAFRFFLLATLPDGKDIIFNEHRLEGYRSFCNKIWNSSRFIFQNRPEGFDRQAQRDLLDSARENGKLATMDLWILDKLNQTIAAADSSMDQYRFHDYCSAIYDFFWKDFCDWYLELSKPRAFGHDGEEEQQLTVAVLCHVLDASLQILHPVMPFITEEISEKLGSGYSILSAFPEHIDLSDYATEEAVQHLEEAKELIYVIRNIRGEMNIPPGQKCDVKIRNASALIQAILDKDSRWNLIREVESLAKLGSWELDNSYNVQPTDGTLPFRSGEVYIPLSDIDRDKEVKRRQDLLTKAESALDKVNKKLSNENFVSRAKPEVVEKERQKQTELTEQVNQARQALERLSG
jgi:valyl-tRNA synthetase